MRLHPRAEGASSVAQGILAFSEDGWLVGANRKGLSLLGLHYRDIGAVTWPQLFDSSLDAWRTPAMKSDAREQRPRLLRTVRGLPLYAHMQGLAAAPHPITATACAPSRDALAAMDTGDAQWRAAADKARRVVDKAIALLVLGESGVGKELFAKAVHASSQRAGKPFVAVNCAALPEHLIEAELFGYAPGAFTGALRQGSLGRLRQAHGGTLFLDEIGDMPLALQTRLLRVLQERQVTPVGSGTAVAVDFNLVCATHQNLQKSVEHGRFRADLYYRINGLAVQLPALRQRTDFAELTQRLLDTLAPQAGIRIDEALLTALARHPWPGNLRQFSHVLRTAVALLAEHESTITWAHMPDDLLGALQQAAAAGPSDRPAQNLRELSRKAFDLALENTHGNVAAAARQLGVSRQTMYRKLKEAGPNRAM